MEFVFTVFFFHYSPDTYFVSNKSSYPLFEINMDNFVKQLTSGSIKIDFSSSKPVTQSEIIILIRFKAPQNIINFFPSLIILTRNGATAAVFRKQRKFGNFV